MQHDEVIWQLINHGHCSFRVKTEKQNFCQNEYNVTGLCNRSSCPLANSKYATIREDNGRTYLYIKTVERAHTPKNLWQKIRLKKQYTAALAQIDEHLAYWPKYLIHKNKQRLTKITQYLIRMRKLQLKTKKKIVTMPARKEKMERRKEAKAEAAAQLDRAIEKELLSRLQSGTYGDIYNFPSMQYKKVLQQQAIGDENAEMDKVLAEDIDLHEESEEEYDEFIEEDEDSEDEEEEIEYLDEDQLGFDVNEMDSDDDIEDYSDDGSGSDGSDGSDDDDDDDDVVVRKGGDNKKRRRSAIDSDDNDDDSDDNEPSRRRVTRSSKAAVATRSSGGAGPSKKKGGQRGKRGGRGVEIEYEMEHGVNQSTMMR